MGNATVTENVTLIRLKPNNGNDSNHSVTLTVTLNNRRGDIGSTHRGSLAGREGRPALPVMAAAHQMFDSKKLAARPTGGLAPVVYGSSPTLYWHVVQEGSAPLLNHCGYWLLPSFIA
ncbi:hypothetical protein [Bifidobacterium longum]|uniref:hypothetical protein n=1 Tax=Bifidobacterium longum TaxID=216816 RepID=UPI0035300C0F